MTRADTPADQVDADRANHAGHADHADDPQLKALRAVWLEMRDSDEDPPMRGLDALMAAARVQADAMATPPWWKRLAASLRRPPVLALASVAVLIGGAVLVTRHGAIEKAQTTVPAGAPVPELPDPSRNSDLDLQPGSAATSPAPSPATAPITRPLPPPAVPAPAAETRRFEQGASGEAQHHRTAAPATPHASSRPTPAPTPASTETPRPRSAADPAFAADKAPVGKPADDDGGRAGAGTALEKDERPEPGAAQTRGPATVLVDQLATQARSAAERGDCENARAIAQRIARQDAAYYREHVAPEPAIARCIAPPKAAAPAH